MVMIDERDLGRSVERRGFELDGKRIVWIGWLLAGGLGELKAGGGRDGLISVRTEWKGRALELAGNVERGARGKGGFLIFAVRGAHYGHDKQFPRKAKAKKAKKFPSHDR